MLRWTLIKLAYYIRLSNIHVVALTPDVTIAGLRGDLRCRGVVNGAVRPLLASTVVVGVCHGTRTVSCQ